MSKALRNSNNKRNWVTSDSLPCFRKKRKRITRCLVSEVVPKFSLVEMNAAVGGFASGWFSKSWLDRRCWRTCSTATREKVFPGCCPNRENRKGYLVSTDVPTPRRRGDFPVLVGRSSESSHGLYRTVRLVVRLSRVWSTWWASRAAG